MNEFYESVLRTIKELIIGDNDDTTFDPELIVHINSSLSRLYELGVTKDAIRIRGEADTWNMILGDSEKFENVKQYIYISTKLIFDPPSSSYVLTYLKEERDKLEWLLNVKAEEVSQNG